MSDRIGQIQQVLDILARHGALVAEGLDGSVHLGSKARDKAIDALVSIHALTPYEEGAYRLNPRLREFISDHLVSYNAFQTLTRLSEPIYRTKTQWRNLKEMKENGVLSDAERLEWALDDTVTEIVYEIDRNLTLLNSLISTEYGNVESLDAKLKQNRFYAREVEESLKELRQLDAMVDEIDAESLIAGFMRVRQLVNGRLRSRLHHWITRLNDIQAVISKRLFLAQRMEKKLVNLGKAALWLSQNKTSSGFDIDVDANFPVELLRPEPVRVRWHTDVRDTDPVVWAPMVEAASRMPSPQDTLPEKIAVEEVQLVLQSSPEPIAVVLDPVDEMIDLVADALYSGQSHRVSLLDWKNSHPELAQVSEEEWMLFASSQLVTHGFKTEFRMVERQPWVHNDLFHDVTVYASA